MSGSFVTYGFLTYGLPAPAPAGACICPTLLYPLQGTGGGQRLNIASVICFFLSLFVTSHCYVPVLCNIATVGVPGLVVFQLAS